MKMHRSWTRFRILKMRTKTVAGSFLRNAAMHTQLVTDPHLALFKNIYQSVLWMGALQFKCMFLLLLLQTITRKATVRPSSLVIMPHIKCISGIRDGKSNAQDKRHASSSVQSGNVFFYSPMYVACLWVDDVRDFVVIAYVCAFTTQHECAHQADTYALHSYTMCVICLHVRDANCDFLRT